MIMIRLRPITNKRREKNIPRKSASVASCSFARETMAEIEPPRSPRMNARIRKPRPIIAVNPTSGKKSLLPSCQKVLKLKDSESFIYLAIVPMDPPKTNTPRIKTDRI